MTSDEPMTAGRLLGMLGCALMIQSCAVNGHGDTGRLAVIPADNEYCLAAQRVVTRTELAMTLQVQPDFQSFVKSKALIEGPTIQQFNWPGVTGGLLGISCKLKSADHLLGAFGPGTAGPDGACQEFNRAVYALVAGEVAKPVFTRVVFDPQETVANEENPGMTGPDWLAPFTLTSVDADGALRIHTKGFIVNFDDPRYAQMPPKFRGVHYCHFIAPDHLRDLLAGRARPGATIGRVVDANPGAVTR